MKTTFAIFLAVLCCSCRADVDDWTLESNTDRGHKVALSNAVAELNHFLASRSTTRTFILNVEHVSYLTKSLSSQTRSNDICDTLFYAIPFEDGGYAILGADNRLDPIIAFVDSGCIEDMLSADISVEEEDRIVENDGDIYDENESDDFLCYLPDGFVKPEETLYDLLIDYADQEFNNHNGGASTI